MLSTFVHFLLVQRAHEVPAKCARCRDSCRPKLYRRSSLRYPGGTRQIPRHNFSHKEQVIVCNVLKRTKDSVPAPKIIPQRSQSRNLHKTRCISDTCLFCMILRGQCMVSVGHLWPRKYSEWFDPVGHTRCEGDTACACPLRPPFRRTEPQRPFPTQSPSSLPRLSTTRRKKRPKWN